jgi:SAM-dependent methyltransferase
MHPGEYEVMARAEERHWWYRGLRDALGRSLARPDVKLPLAPAVLDAGCGTGATLRFLAERLTPAYLGGFDLSQEALALARQKLAPFDADLYQSDLCDPVLPSADLDLIVSFDVLSVPGVTRALPGLFRLVERLRVGGLLVLNLPAYAWLRSEHDVAVHGSQRFRLGEVRDLLGQLGLEVVCASHRLCALFPAVLASRLPGVLRRTPPGDPEARSQLHGASGGALGGALLGVLKLENVLMARGATLPFGSSVFAVGRKR